MFGRELVIDMGSIATSFEGHFMSLSLRSEDRLAVDLLLDHSAKALGSSKPAPAGTETVYANVDRNVVPRIARARHLLQLLDLLPDGDPPADLVVRTVRFVERQSHGVMPADLPVGVNPIHSHT
jgi:hypothetical protein